MEQNTPKQTPPGRPHWGRAVGLLVLGCSIGLSIVLIRTLTESGSFRQLAGLIIAAVAISLLNIALRRRMWRRPPPKAPAPQRPQRPKPSELFSQENDQSWTGLADPDELQEPQPRSRE